MIIGFTGTQEGMSTRQCSKLSTWLITNRSAITEAHHGMCIGADEEFHYLCLALDICLIGHPPIKQHKMMSYSELDFEFIYESKEYLARNKDIVNESYILIATPKTNFEELRSGTWSTIRYARKLDRQIRILKR